MEILLAVIGAAIGSIWHAAAWGWAIGSTIGALLSREDTNTTTKGPRITDFKAANSKYGVPIFRGYGCVRLAPNLIWAGDVTETSISTTTCVSQGGFFGLFETESCQTVVEYKYSQSFALAFAEGPATAILRLWADGDLIADFRSSNTGPVTTLVEDNTDAPANPSIGTSMRTYLGTSTQEIDPAILADLGANEATAFRNLVYVVFDDIDLEQFSFRIPVLNAEVAFPATNAAFPSTPWERGPENLDGDLGEPGMNFMTACHNLMVSHDIVDPGTVTAIGVWNVQTQQLISWLIPAPWEGLTSSDQPSAICTSPDGWSVASGFISGSTTVHLIYNVFSGRVAYARRYVLPPPANPNELPPYVNEMGGVTCCRYDRVRGMIWVGARGGILQDEQYVTGYPIDVPSTYEPALPDDFPGSVTVSLQQTHPIDGQIVPLLSEIDGVIHYPIGAMEASVIMFDADGDVWYVAFADTPFFGESYIGCPAKGVKVRLKETTAQDSAQDLLFIDAAWYTTGPTAGVVVAAQAGATELGLYKYNLSSLLAAASGANLNADTYEAYTGGSALTISPATVHAPIVDNLITAEQNGSVVRISLESLKVAYTYSGGDIQPTVGGGMNDPIYDPWQDAVHFNDSVNDNWVTTYIRTDCQTTTLDQIVTDLMTKDHGESRARLTTDDIDVSALTTTIVRGYSLLSQQTARSALIPLQQAFLFDSVESDGKVKFVKRGGASVVTIPEDDLAAHDFSTTANKSLIPVEHERKAEAELPRELSVNYTDYDLDYNQGTQRARRLQTDAESNATLTIPVVMKPDEAAQVTDILLSNFWIEREAPFKFQTGPKYMRLEPTDNITISMDDGTTYFLRINSMEVGANGICQFEAVAEYVSLYTSNVEGVGNLNPLPSLGQVTSCIQPLVLDVPLHIFRGLEGAGNQAKIGLGVGTFGRGLSCGTSLIQIIDGSGANVVGSISETENGCSTWGYTTSELGHPSGPAAFNVVDNENTINVRIIGGYPELLTSVTFAQQLTGRNFVVVGNEIISYQTVNYNGGTLVGTDISADTTDDSLNSSTTDFTTLFSIGDFVRVSGFANDENNFFQEVATVSSTKMTFVTPDNLVTESAGPTVTLVNPDNTLELSGLLRGLGGTDPYIYHHKGDQVVFIDDDFGNLEFPPVSGETIPPAVLQVKLIQNSVVGRDTVLYAARALRPFSVADPVAAELTGATTTIEMSWVRRDRRGDDLSGSNLNKNSEGAEQYEVDILACDGEILRTLTASDEPRVEYVLADQTTDFGGSKETPFVVDIYQMSPSVGRGFRNRIEMDRDGDYTPTGITMNGETTGVAPSFGSNRFEQAATWTTQTGGSIGSEGKLLRGNGNSTTALSPLDISDIAGCALDFEFFVVMRSDGFGPSRQSAGVVMRGQGNDGSTADDLASQAWISVGIVSTGLQAEIKHVDQGLFTYVTTDTSFTTATNTWYGLRVRWFRNRLQARIWNYPGTEPTTWNIDDYYPQGPFFGFPGLIANNDIAEYDYIAWAHRGLTAA